MDQSVFVWILDLGGEPLGSGLEGAACVLSDTERMKAAQYVNELARAQFLAGRLLLRFAVFSEFSDKAAALGVNSWRWTTGARADGKPVISGADVPVGLSFNLSHSRHIVACAVAKGREVGIDVEHEKCLDFEELVELWCSPAEAASIGTYCGKARLERFYTLWTLKEAYLKARGVGLIYPIKDVSFGQRAEGSMIRVSDFHDPSASDQWRCMPLAMPLGYRGALCWEIRHSQEVPEVACRTVDLASMLRHFEIISNRGCMRRHEQ
ncbi:4'-phosphopantetheinyl transferase family protein [Azospirillum argentinense]